jgi:hypothetical protein
MAKHVILESYTFTPSTRTVVITGKNIRKEQLLLITNTSTGTVIYNFSDPSLNSTSYTNAVDPVTGQETTTIILAYNTSAMSASATLSILVEETYQEIIPSEVMRDPVDKLRVSNPQALIDTDFEYGIQPTKWESISLCNNRPSAFVDYTQPLANTAANTVFTGSSGTYWVTNITSSGKVVTVSINNTAGIVIGKPFFIQGTLDAFNVDGWWVVEAVTSNTSFTFTVINTPFVTALFDPLKSYIFMGDFYTAAAIPAGTSGVITISAGSVATVTTANAHGLQVNNAIYVINTTGATGGTATANGSFLVASVPNQNVFTYNLTGLATGGTVTTQLNNSIFTRPAGYVQHRAFDGGVQFSNVSPYQGYQVIRQTRRYFRYQSGKGIQFSTGSILKPSLSVENVTSSGTTVTVATKYPHGLLSNANVAVSGAVETAYNGTFAVTSATANTFTYTALSTPAAPTANGFPITVSPSSWYGSTNRVGMFDSQNGFYYEFDGQTLYAVKRSSTLQIAGSSAVSIGSNIVTGTNTKYSSQLKPGDFIVIRGQSYIVQSITSDTQLMICPEYRGVNASSAVVSKTVNTRYPQSSWNIDKCDGTGASRFNLDLTKMQMFYMDYTWYGAGAIRFGFKNNRGEVVYCHRIPNSNVNTEAYMRSGNLPARYETNTIPPWTYLTQTLSSSATTGATISVADTTNFANNGTLILSNPGNNGTVELVSYTAKAANSFTIASRAVVGGNTAAQQFTYSNTAPIQVEAYSPQFASTLSHWGSSVIMDGKYDDDKSFVFNYGMQTPYVATTQYVRYPLMSIRLGPSVDNGTTGVLGVREIINRMQLTLRGMDCYTSSSAFRIELILNGRVSGGTFTQVGGSSLAQVALHTNTQTITGGESIYGFFTNSAAATSQDLSLVRDIGTSILGGGTSLSVPTTVNNIYPDGPDIITVVATALTNGGNINARISWTEAQA